MKNKRTQALRQALVELDAARLEMTAILLGAKGKEARAIALRCKIKVDGAYNAVEKLMLMLWETDDPTLH